MANTEKGIINQHLFSWKKTHNILLNVKKQIDKIFLVCRQAGVRGKGISQAHAVRKRRD